MSIQGQGHFLTLAQGQIPMKILAYILSSETILHHAHIQVVETL